jgi:hypothetical protein
VYAVKEGYFPVQRTFIKEFPDCKVNVNKDETSEKKIIEKAWKVQNSSEIERDVIILLVKESYIIDRRLILMVTYTNFFEENFQYALQTSSNGKILQFLK